MNNLPKLIRRFTGILLLSFVLLVFANFAILAFLMAWQSPSVTDSPYNVAIQTGKAFQISESGYTFAGRYFHAIKKTKYMGICC